MSSSLSMSVAMASEPGISCSSCLSLSAERAARMTVAPFRERSQARRKTDAARGSRDDGDFILDLHGGSQTCRIKIEVFNQRAGISRKLYPAISLQMRLCYFPRLDELREQRDIALSDFDRSNRPNRHFGLWPKAGFALSAAFGSKRARAAKS